MVSIRSLTPESSLPLLIEPEPSPGIEGAPDGLISWHEQHRDFVELKLLECSAVLCRGFGVKTPSAFSRLVRAVSGGLLDYVDGNSPRTKLTAGIYTSSEYPSDYFISLHSELSYSHRWPSKLYFCCITAPDRGGETPLADNRAVVENLSPDIVEEFARKQVKYLRNLHGGRGVGPSWQDTFETKDRAIVENFCRGASIEYEWIEDGGLALAQVRPAVAVHPKTNEQVWFNQADQFHPSTHPKNVYESIGSLYKGREDRLPQSVCFGDDTPIDVAMLDEIRETVQRQAISFPWRQGDVLIVDNMLACHGRMPFTGARKILVAMS